jgi:hypothetical protein
MTGPATVEQLEELWSLVLLELRSKLSGLKVSAEMLQVARVFLNDNHFISSKVNSPVTRRQMERIDSLYREKLIEGLTSPNPSAGLLAEARHWRERIERQQSQQQAEDGTLPIDMPVPFKVK